MRPTTFLRRVPLMAASFAIGALLLSACSSSPAGQGSKAGGTAIRVVAAENEYGNVAAQIGGKYVTVTSIESNPNTDPHTYEVEPQRGPGGRRGPARHPERGRLRRVHEQDRGGVAELEAPGDRRAGAARAARQHAEPAPLVQPDDHARRWRPHWPTTCPTLAAGPRRVLQGQRGDVRSRRSSRGCRRSPHFKATYPGTPVATTEPVADYMLEAAGTDNLTPVPLQADIMNGVDPSPQDVSPPGAPVHQAQGEGVRLQPAGDRLAHRDASSPPRKRPAIPVVGVYETMPTPGYDYQSWMLAEVQALQQAPSTTARRPQKL